MAAPHSRTVFYLDDEEAEIIRRHRKAVQAQRQLNRRRSLGLEGNGDIDDNVNNAHIASNTLTEPFWDWQQPSPSNLRKGKRRAR